MTLTIGRFGRELSAGEVETADLDGGTLKLAGTTNVATMADAAALRALLTGYIDNPDEDFVPVTWDGDPSINGFYRVTGAAVSAAQGVAVQGVVNWDATLERVQGFAAPLIEDVILGTLRPSALGLTAIRWVGIPASAKSFVEYANATFTQGDTAAVRIGEKASVGIYRNLHDSCIAQFYVPPANHYDGAATLLISDKAVAGRQVPNSATSWMLSNDLIRLRMAAGSTFRFEFQKWNGTAWSAWHPLDIQSAANLPLPAWSNIMAPHTITVLRNSPELVVIRIVTTLDGRVARPVTIDISLRRGARTFGVQYHSPGVRLIRALSSEMSGATATTGGVKKQLSTGANGEVLILGSPREVSYATGVGGGSISPTSSGTPEEVNSWAFTFGVSTVPEESDSFNTDVALREYFWAGTDKQTVVAQ